MPPSSLIREPVNFGGTAGQGGKGRHVLLADDNYANRLVAHTVLMREGYSLTLAKDGAEAVRFANTHTYDLIILDIQMPIMDGLEAFKQIRQNKSTNQNAPIFALTAYSSQEEIRIYRDTGFAIVLAKPLKPNDIAKAWTQFHTHFKARTETCDRPHEGSNWPLLDEATLTRFYQIADPQTLTRLVNAFWMDIDKCLETMNQILTLASQDVENKVAQFSRHAHMIKGAAINVGALRVHHIARQLQDAEPDEIENIHKALKISLALTRPLLLPAFLRGYGLEDYRFNDCAHDPAPTATRYGDEDERIRSAQTRT